MALCLLTPWLSALGCESPPAALPDVAKVTGACRMTVAVTGMH
jgi:hypothetical protein